ncbi:TetR/AcrR family transcriptional regulator [Streptomyces hebeiensis]|uniref:TetR/AcrR family transcriptional regulator n=1 Tax=Streptomyces hebeiensis TaxID=229486 RepID=A0ABN1UZQ1_9ACTN
MTQRRPRRTTADVERAILEAARDELRERGYAGVTFEGVARRAATSKPVIYRRYSSRATLVFTALRTHFEDASPTPNTGTLRGDLIAWLKAAQDRASEVGEDTYRATMGEADAELLDAVNALVHAETENLEQKIIAPARARGELGPVPLTLEVLAVPSVLLRDRVFFGRTTGDDAAEIVDEVCLPLFRARSGMNSQP